MEIIIPLLVFFLMKAFLAGLILLFIKSQRSLGRRILLYSGSIFMVCIIAIGLFVDLEEEKISSPLAEEYRLAEARNMKDTAEEDEVREKVENAEAKKQPEDTFYKLPEQQITFMSIISEHKEKYEAASSSLIKKNLRHNRANKVCQLLLNGEVRGWGGIVKEISPTSFISDEASLEVKLVVDEQSILVIRDRNISPDHPVYQQLAYIDIGSRISFSGFFAKNDGDSDCLVEESWFEKGAMREPEYVFQFSDIQFPDRGREIGVFYDGSDKKVMQKEAEFYMPPEKQKAFVSIINEYRAKYRDTSNPARKVGLRKDRANAICQLFPDGKVQKWIGILKDVSTEFISDDATVEIELVNAPNVKIVSSETISSYSSIYNQLERVEIGSKIAFDGVFVRNDSDSDCFVEKSWFEKGAMQEPEFLFYFRKIGNFDTYWDESSRNDIDPNIANFFVGLIMLAVIWWGFRRMKMKKKRI